MGLFVTFAFFRFKKGNLPDSRKFTQIFFSKIESGKNLRYFQPEFFALDSRYKCLLHSKMNRTRDGSVF